MPVTSVADVGQSGQSARVFSNSQLQGEDFLRLMIEELVNQDPLDPMKNQELLAQVSQIKNMETLSNLDQTMTRMTFQDGLSAGAALIGRFVSGISTADENASGLIAGVTASSTKGVMVVTTEGIQIPVSKVTEVWEVVQG